MTQSVSGGVGKVHEAVGVHLAHELEGGPCLLATWEMHVDTTVLLVTPAAKI